MLNHVSICMPPDWCFCLAPVTCEVYEDHIAGPDAVVILQIDEALDDCLAACGLGMPRPIPLQLTYPTVLCSWIN
jgi:hypothetical protein